jgi:diguanylate cyclase (GGDEF)-like protein
MLVLVTFYTYNFVGTRFVFALCVDLLLLLIYNQLFGNMLHYPPHILAGHDFFIISANLIGGSAGYLAEMGRKNLFLREQELEEQRQYHQMRALHDGLTGLPNRELLYDRISQAMAKAHREGSIHCGIFLDLDGFKEINDTLSHEVGDHVLRQVGQSLLAAVRGIDTVARIGGDEFFVLALNIGTEQAAGNLAKKLVQELAKPLPGIPENTGLGVSIGVCLFPYPGMTVSDMIHRADEAMYQVKNHGKGSFAFAADHISAFL